ncbi:MAG: sialate O-acetylesterase [Pirellulales bacterium]|nr:sialate O-acetylesterase [Pirellulales bacterium]
MLKVRIFILVGWCLTMLGDSVLVAAVRLPRLLSEHAVLQRDKPIRIWGWADPGEEVTVSLADKSARVTTTAEGTWLLELPALSAGGPHELRVQGKNLLTVPDILIGEVWVCSGQSNMEWVVVKTKNEAVEKAAAKFDKMRLMTVPKLETAEPQADAQVEWRVCNPQTVSYFSGVAYFFGREIHQKLDVPVGLIVSAVGGTRIEPWTNREGVDLVPQLTGKDPPPDGQYLYNGMINPLHPLNIRGFIWYQGEGNVGDGMIYRYRMEALIRGWRKAWRDDELPFYYVQIAPLNWGGKPVDVHPQLWEAQTAALEIPHTGMAVTNDIAGHVGDAHPRNKKDVGIRLALWARTFTYGEKDLVYSGPLYQSHEVENNAIRLKFRHVHGGLTSRDGKPLTWFTIAGEDQKFHPATAEIDGETIVVKSDLVPRPVAVRFGWHQIAEPNLMNKEGLPAPSFRTDRWENSSGK